MRNSKLNLDSNLDQKMGLLKLFEKTFLGDGAFVRFDGYHVLLSTEDGISETNVVALDSEVLQAFKNWLNDLEKEK